MELNDFIYDFNLAATRTVTDVYEMCATINSGRTREIEYDNCVSLYDFVEMFNTSYMNYMEDKIELRKILDNLGKEVFYRFHDASDDYTSICFNVLNPFSNVFEGDRALVHFVNNEDNYYAWANNGKRRFDKDYKSTAVNIEEETIKSCLDIVKRNSLYLESFTELFSHVIANGPTTVCSEITGDVLGCLKTFTLSFGNSFLSSTDLIKVRFKLGDNFKILYNKSQVMIEDKVITNSKKKEAIIKELLSSIYINSESLPGLYKQDVAKQYVKKGENI